jgi:5-hydroxyisourate hydrolase
MSAITTHVLDTARGVPAAGIHVSLEAESGGVWMTLGGGVTDADGRARNLLPEGVALTAGVYRLTFDTQSYQPDGLYPVISITFRVQAPVRHYHIPLLFSANGYTTYRGS